LAHPVYALDHMTDLLLLSVLGTALGYYYQTSVEVDLLATLRRHSRDDPREDVGEDVGVRVRVRVECQLS